MWKKSIMNSYEIKNFGKLTIDLSATTDQPRHRVRENLNALKVFNRSQKITGLKPNSHLACAIFQYVLLHYSVSVIFHMER